MDSTLSKMVGRVKFEVKELSDLARVSMVHRSL